LEWRFCIDLGVGGGWSKFDNDYYFFKNKEEEKETRDDIPEVLKYLRFLFGSFLISIHPQVCVPPNSNARPGCFWMGPSHPAQARGEKAASGSPIQISGIQKRRDSL
jgi:hypothetical protein